MDDSCANPLLLGFLKEWYDKEKQRNAKGAVVYKRAYESMKACPIRFQHPSEASVLKGLGPKLCAKLEESLRRHCETHGLPVPKLKRRRDPGAERDNSETPGDDPVPPPKRQQPKKPYVPAKRSGAYALLYALYKAGDDVMLTKQELIDRARPYCDSSFDAPAQANKFYTAWSSMANLKGKNYIYENGNPKRFILTDTGKEVAKGIVDAEERRRDGDVVGAARTDRDCGLQPAIAPGSKRRDIPSMPYGGRRVAQDVDDEDYYQRLVQMRRRMHINSSNRGNDDGLAAAQARYAELSGNGGQLEYGKRRPVAPPQRNTPSVLPTEIDLTTSPKRPLSTPLRQLRTPNPNVRTTFRGDSDRTASRAESVTSITSSRAPTSTRPSTAHPRSTSASATAPCPSALGSKPSFPDFTPGVLKAGSYVVHLVLDNREVRTKHDRDYIQDNLADAGVKPITRPLQVGDAMWVAREKGGQMREIVLDYIIERKRLDDLVSSIRDGRFHEQKFRLAKSGLKHVVLIIEDFTLRETDQAMQESIDTAISSTQVVNGFFVKKTGKLDDTIRYLVRMTRMLEKIYQERDLSLIPDNLLESRTYQALRKHLTEKFPDRNFYINYPIFSTLVSKSANMTLRDLFLKMLMCVRGISLEKAIEIQKAYPTPIELVEAYERCADEEEANEMVMKKFANAVGRKKIGAAVSVKVAEVWAGAGIQDPSSEEMEEDD